MKKLEKDFSKAKPLPDNALLDLVQRQTLQYFWDFAHPVSGMARERSNPIPDYNYKETVTTGGTGFGIMALLTGVKRGWLKRDEVHDRIDKIVTFLEGADKYHGVFPHFLDGRTGKIIPFSPKDDGGDLVETSFLMMGLLSARQYFSEDKELCGKINKIWEAVEWDWHTRGQDNKLYWHWSPNHGWDMNLPVEGWDEALVTHVLAAASPTHPVSAKIYENVWTKGAHFKNTQSTPPLGPKKGGPLFFSHYSFLGLNPKGLKDKYADYWQQNYQHVQANRTHCLANPNQYKGYGENCWGLTASDGDQGYSAHSPSNDKGVITPTAALSSFPYTPKESMQVLRHFYEELGSKLWGKYGFYDAFNETKNWVADNYLAIDQGPIVVMIENHRSGMLWDLFMGCPEVKQALKKLNFKSPYLQSVNKPSSSKNPGHSH